MIVLKGVTKRFRLGRSHKYVARDVNCVFPARTSVALLGRNGAGKSTLTAAPALPGAMEVRRLTVPKVSVAEALVGPVLVQLAQG